MLSLCENKYKNVANQDEYREASIILIYWCSVQLCADIHYF